MDVIHKQDQGTTTETPKLKRKIKEKPLTEEPVVVEKKKGDSRKLRKRLQEFAEMNETMKQALETKNMEIADLKRSVQSLNDVLNSVPIDELRCNSSIASTKLLELSKKNRQLRAELETAKHRINKKEMQIQKVERDMRLLEEKFSADVENASKIPAPYDELQSKMNALQQKFFETRNKNLELQAQLKLAQKRFQQEVGENANINILAPQSSLSNWRGRAQQILHLQQKVHELKERLEMYEHQSGVGRVSSYVDSTIEQTLGTKQNGMIGASETSMLSNQTSNTSFDRFSPNVRKTEILHRAKVEGLEKEINLLKSQIEEQRGKVLALKVRNKTLNDELVKYKVRASSLEQQTDYNGLNLASMNEKLNMQRYQYETRLDEMSRELKDTRRSYEESMFKAEELRLKLDNVENMVDSKDAYIEELNKIIKKLETDLKAVCGGFLFSCRELRKEEFIAILDSLEAEKNQLMSYNKTMKERAEQERSKNENLTEQLSKQKIRMSRLEAKIRELEKELEQQTERKKRSQRITDYVNSVSSGSTINNMASFVFENSSLLHVGNVSSEDLTPTQVSDLRNQLEFATEKVTMLEEKIEHLIEEKENDARTFEQIINSSKSILLDTILGRKSSSTVCHEERSEAT